MAVVIALGIAAAVVAFVVAPLFLVNERAPRGASGDADTFEALEELVAEKETLYAAIQELDFDLKSGKLSAEDCEALRERYEIQAAAILQRMDELQQANRQPSKPRGSRQEKRKG